MWPWEHLAVAYLCYSVLVRTLGSRPPTPTEAWAVAIGSQVPDLVDKPLAWTFHLLPSGVSFAHSAFVAVPVALLARVVAGRRGAAPVGTAFAVGYLSHLPADVFYPLAFGGGVSPGVVLWPLYTAGTPVTNGLFANVSHYAASLVGRLGTPRGVGYLLVEAALLAAAVGRWTADGRPGRFAGVRRGTGDENADR